MPPVISRCPSDINQLALAGSTTSRVQWIEPTASDNSGMTPTSTRSHTPGSSFPIGSTQVTYAFTDESGNQALCSFTVVISGKNDNLNNICKSVITF